MTAGVEDLPHARRATATAVVAGLLVGAGIGSGCGDHSSMAPEGHPVEPVRIVLGAPDGEAGSSTLELVGLSGAQLSAIRDATLTADEWQALFRVSVGASADEVWSLPPVLGAYAVTGDAIRFSPRYGFDAGRDYRVVFDPARFPPRANGLVQAGSWPIIDEAVATPAADVRPPTRVEQVYPSADVLPENLLRLYIQFSGPMGLRGGADYVRLVDANGQAVDGPFLPLDLALWNSDRTRYTLLLDPGRVKQGIRPNRELHRALVAGGVYTLVIDRGWPDAFGAPLAESFTRTFTVAPPRDHAIEPTQWQLAVPLAGTRDPLVVSFPAPLDHALLHRALLVTTDHGRVVGGEVSVEAAETRWAFTPHEAWRSLGHRLTPLPTLEDPAGNRVGRAFEVPSAAEPVRRDAVEAGIPFVPTSRRP